MKYKKNIISNIIVHVFSLLFGFVSSILIARGLGAENQGQFSFYVLIFGLSAAYGHFGLTTSVSYFIKKTKYEDNHIINTNLSVLLLLSIFYFIVIFFLKGVIFSNNYILLIIWTIYYISLLVSNYFMNIYMAHENVYIYNRFLNLNTILKVTTISILYFTHNISVVSVSITYACLELLKFILMLRGLHLEYKFEIHKNILKEELKYGIPLYLSALFLYLNYRVDQVMVKSYNGEAALGVYALSVTLAELAKMVPDSVVSAFTGKLYNCEEEQKKRIVIQTIKLSFYMTVVISIIGIFCKPLIKILYGEEFIQAGLSMIILLIGIPFLTIGKVSSVYFYTNGKTKVHMRIAFSVLVVNLVLNFLLIPKYGIYGAAFTSTVSYIFYAIVYLIMLNKYNISAKSIMIINKEDISLLKNYLLKLKKKILKK